MFNFLTRFIRRIDRPFRPLRFECDYEILQDDNSYSLALEVKKYLKNGWECQGGVCYDHGYQEYEKTGRGFYQAMVKERWTKVESQGD